MCVRTRSSRPVSLTEAEAEFGVSCIKHVFPAHVVLQFDITNTLEGQWIDAVSVELDLGATEWHEEFAIPSACLGTGAAGVAYVFCVRVFGDCTRSLFLSLFLLSRSGSFLVP